MLEVCSALATFELPSDLKSDEGSLDHLGHFVRNITVLV